MENSISTINNLAQSIIDVFYDDDCEMDKTSYAEDVLKQIQSICNRLATKRYYIRVSENTSNFELENLQLYTEETIKEEFIAIGYITEEQAEFITIGELKEIASENNEVIQEIDVVENLVL